MTNEMKLLMAMCDAMGFEVEEIDTSRKMYKSDDMMDWGTPKLNANPIILPSTDYKLTKKGKR